MSEKVTIKVLLSLEGDFFHPYISGKLLQAAKFELSPPACGQIKRILDIIYEQLNIDEPRADWAIAYRANRHRSLSVGDVVVIGEQAWACDRLDWTPTAVAAEDVCYDIGSVKEWMSR